MSAITVQAEHSKTATLLADAEPKVAEQAMQLKCARCRSDMEEGFFLDVQGSASNAKAASVWVQGPPQETFWTGIKLSGRDQKQVVAYRCTSCGYLELYAR